MVGRKYLSAAGYRNGQEYTETVIFLEGQGLYTQRTQWFPVMEPPHDQGKSPLCIRSEHDRSMVCGGATVALLTHSRRVMSSIPHGSLGQGP